jgi:hypothetical protein
MLIRRVPWTRQPPFSSAGSNFAALRATIGQGTKVAQYCTLTSGGSALSTCNIGGVCASYSSSVNGDTVTNPYWPAAGTDKFTVLVVCQFNSLGSYNSPLDYDKSSLRAFQFRKNTSNLVDLIRFNTSGSPFFATTINTIPTAKPVAFALVSNGATFHIFTEKESATGTITGTPTVLENTINLGASYAGGTYTIDNSDLDGYLYDYAVIPYAVSLATAQQFVRNPYSVLFAPRSIILPLSVAAGGGVPNLSASTYVTGSLTSTGWRPQITAS